MPNYPKPEGERRNRNERALDWITLPTEGRAGPPPKLPDWRPWTDSTLSWWADLWSSPQAVRWDPSGRSLHRLAILHHQLMLDGQLEPERSRLTSISSEMRQVEARHGLTPKAMLDLRWRISDVPGSAVTTTGKVLTLVPERPPASALPGKRAAKSEWVEWAVLCGADKSAAEKLSKAKLIEEFSSMGASLAAQAAPPKPVSKAAERLRAHAAKPARKKPSKKGR